MRVLGTNLRWGWRQWAIASCCFVQAINIGTARGQNIQFGNLRVEMERIVNVPFGPLGIPVAMSMPGDGTDRMFFSEVGGPLPSSPVRVRMLKNGQFSTFLDLTGKAWWTGETGLLGFAFHPGYADPNSPGYRKMYTYASEMPNSQVAIDFELPGSTVHHHNVLTEWQVDANNPDVVDMSTQREIFREAHIGNFHAGGMLEFGPDGYLYGSIGTPNEVFLSAQDNSSIFGKIYRIDPLAPALTPTSGDAISANGKYRIPASNPFVNTPNALGEIFAFGTRSPYRFSIDSETGLLFLGDVGHGRMEEVDVVGAGDNLGWPYREGTLPLVATPNPPPQFVAPIAEYSHSDGIAVIGGYVYRGSIPALQGKYIFGDLSYVVRGVDPGRLFWIDPYDEQGELKNLSENRIQEIALAPASCAESFNAPGDCSFDVQILSFAEGDDGELYVLGNYFNTAVVYKITGAYLLPSGDYNQDGVVDAADYSVWRDTLGSTTDLRANGNDSGASHGVIDAADYAIWKTHFGESVDTGAGGSSVQVPEPSAGALLFLLLAGIASSKGRFGRYWKQVAG
jgi:glucose/arabinose dehydrogenase